MYARAKAKAEAQIKRQAQAQAQAQNQAQAQAQLQAQAQKQAQAQLQAQVQAQAQNQAQAQLQAQAQVQAQAQARAQLTAQAGEQDVQAPSPAQVAGQEYTAAHQQIAAANQGTLAALAGYPASGITTIGGVQYATIGTGPGGAQYVYAQPAAYADHMSVIQAQAAQHQAMQQFQQMQVASALQQHHRQQLRAARQSSASTQPSAAPAAATATASPTQNQAGNQLSQLQKGGSEWQAEQQRRQQQLEQQHTREAKRTAKDKATDIIEITSDSDEEEVEITGTESADRTAVWTNKRKATAIAASGLSTTAAAVPNRSLGINNADSSRQNALLQSARPLSIKIASSKRPVVLVQNWSPEKLSNKLRRKISKQRRLEAIYEVLTPYQTRKTPSTSDENLFEEIKLSRQQINKVAYDIEEGQVKLFENLIQSAFQASSVEMTALQKVAARSANEPFLTARGESQNSQPVEVDLSKASPGILSKSPPTKLTALAKPQQNQQIAPSSSTLTEASRLNLIRIQQDEIFKLKQEVAKLCNDRKLMLESFHRDKARHKDEIERNASAQSRSIRAFMKSSVHSLNWIRRQRQQQDDEDSAASDAASTSDDAMQIETTR